LPGLEKRVWAGIQPGKQTIRGALAAGKSPVERL